MREERNAKIGLSVTTLRLTVKCNQEQMGIYFHATKPISHDVISTVLDTLRKSEDVTPYKEL